MATFYALGKYTAQGYQGFCKDPKSDRAQAARTAAEAVGAKLVSYTGLRGPYDFLAVFEGTFAQGAGIKMATEASGACLLYTSPSPRDKRQSRMPSSA